MRRVLVVGDIISDVYRDCHFRKMCPDAPTVPAIVQGSVDVRPGGAANVAINLATLAPDVAVDLIGVVSEDLARWTKRLSASRVSMDRCAIVPEEDALTKERIFRDGEFLVRLDNLSRVSKFNRDRVGANLRDYLAHSNPDLVVMADYDGGTVYDGEDDTNLQILLGMRDRLLVDTKLTDLSIFEGTLLGKLNEQEWARVVKTEAAPERFFKYLVITHGSQGARLLMRMADIGPIAPNGRFTDRTTTHEMRVRALPVHVVDVCGCGDTFLAGLAAMMLKNADPFSAIQFANSAAATVVRKPRTAIADRELAMRSIGRTE